MVGEVMSASEKSGNILLLFSDASLAFLWPIVHKVTPNTVGGRDNSRAEVEKIFRPNPFLNEFNMLTLLLYCSLN